MKRLFAALLLGLAALAMLPAHAGEAAPLAADPAAEKRLIALTEQLRCLVCQNQNIADSHAELAMDLKREVRNMITAGKSDKEIMDFMVTRYGDFVLYNPPFKATTLLLWGGPLLLMLIGMATLISYMRRRNQRVSDDTPLTAEEQKRAAALLTKDSES